MGYSASAGPSFPPRRPEGGWLRRAGSPASVSPPVAAPGRTAGRRAAPPSGLSAIDGDAGLAPRSPSFQRGSQRRRGDPPKGGPDPPRTVSASYVSRITSEPSTLLSRDEGGLGRWVSSSPARVPTPTLRGRRICKQGTRKSPYKESDWLDWPDQPFSNWALSREGRCCRLTASRSWAGRWGFWEV